MDILVILIACAVNALIVALLVATAVRGHNRVVRLRHAADAAWAQIEVQLARRHALVPNLVETVRAAAAHERDAIDAVLAARGAAASVHDPVGSAAYEATLGGAVHRLVALAEQYPTLRADRGFAALQQELSVIEDKIAYSRQFYNVAVQRHNETIQSFPERFVAGRGARPYPYFELPAEHADPVSVRFPGPRPPLTGGSSVRRLP